VGGGREGKEGSVRRGDGEQREPGWGGEAEGKTEGAIERVAKGENERKEEGGGGGKMEEGEEGSEGGR